MDNLDTAGAGPAPVYSQPPEVYSYYMRVKLGRVKGAVSDFRDGGIHLEPGGVTIDGKAVLPIVPRVAILVGSALLCWGFLIAYILVEYVIRRRETVRLAWADVDEIVAEQRRQRICLVYNGAAKAAKPRLVSLAFGLDPGLYDHFVSVVRHLAPDKLREGRIGSPNSPATWAFAVVFIALVILMFVWMAHQR